MFQEMKSARVRTEINVELGSGSGAISVRETLEVKVSFDGTGPNPLQGDLIDVGFQSMSDALGEGHYARV